MAYLANFFFASLSPSISGKQLMPWRGEWQADYTITLWDWTPILE